jgi:hypothetical protein
MNKTISGLMAIASWVAQPLAAQTSPAAGVAFPDQDAAWSVSVKETAKQTSNPQSSSSAQQQSVSLVRIETIETPAMRSDTFFWSDGRSSQNWSINGIVLSENPHNGSIYILANKGFLGLSNKEIVFDQDFFAWTRSTTPASSDFDGKSYLFYAKPFQGAGSSVRTIFLKAEIASSFTEAVYVDPATRLPAIYLRGNQSYQFTFKSPSNGDLKMPPQFLAKYNRYKLYH